MDEEVKQFIKNNKKQVLMYGGCAVALILIALWFFPIPRYSMQVISPGVSHKLDKWTGNVYIVNYEGERLLKKESNRKRKIITLRKDEIRKLDGRGGRRELSEAFNVTLYNGNRNVAITELEIEIVAYETCESWKSIYHNEDSCDYCFSPTEKYRQRFFVRFSNPVMPLDTRDSSANILFWRLFEKQSKYNDGKYEISNNFTWDIVGAKGFRVDE